MKKKEKREKADGCMNRLMADTKNRRVKQEKAARENPNTYTSVKYDKMLRNDTGPTERSGADPG